MATGGSPSKGSSSDSHARSGWQSTSDDAVSMNSIQNELRPNNLEVSEWKESTLESNKRRKKGNRERERERGQSLLQDLPSPTERRQHTPSSYSRTKLPPNAELSERMELENLKQHFSFDDYEVSSDDEKNNEKTVSFNRRDMPPNYTRQDTSSTISEHHRHSDGESRKNQKTNKKNRNRTGDARYPSEEIEEKEKNDEKRGAQNNISQDRAQEAITDSNQIVARMMQIKDYRKQIKLMMDTLQESDDPTDHRKISKLAQVLNSLEEQESSYMEILQKLWIIRKRALLNSKSNPNETAKGDSPDDTDSVDSQTSDPALHTFTSGLPEKSEDLTSIEQQQILLKQIMEQKEQLKKLQERQSALLAIEKDAVQKLAEAKERQRLLQDPTVDNMAAPEFAFYQRDNQPAENTIEDVIEEHRKMQNNLPLSNPQSEDNLMTVDLENLGFDPADFQERICQGRLSLQNKLKHLQEKRRCVNELLRYVKSLRSQSTDDMSQMNNNPENTENSVQNSENVTEKTDSPEDDLNLPEPNEKWEELLGVRERLNHLRSLFKEYQVCANDEATEAKDVTSTEEGEKTQNHQQIKSSSCEASDKYSDSNHIQNLSDFEEDFNTELGSLISQPGVRDKLNELQEAKDRLRHLQKLINKLNDSPDGPPEQTAEELAEVLAQSDNQAISKQLSRSAGLPEASALPNGADFTQVSHDQLIPLQNKSAKLKLKMQEQQLEVDRLKDQRERLLSFHQQLLNFHDSLPSWNDEMDKSDRDKTNEVTFAPEPEIQDLNQMTYSSNDELYNKMRKERIQREELRQRKKEMEDLMHKDKPKRNYSRNQDNQSDSVSYSTDFLGANTSADVTMATWGGSTADNFENINEGCDRDDDEEEEEGDDDEERDDINEEFNEDDDYLSDVIRDAEEGGESSSKETYTIEKDARRHVKQSQPGLLGCMPLDSRGNFPPGKRNKYCCQRSDSKGNSPNQKQFGRTNSGFARKQENIRAAEYIIQEDEHDESLQSESSPLNIIERQMDKMANTYQELLIEQQQLRQQLHMMRYQNTNAFAFDANQPTNMYWQSNPFLTPPAEVQNSASQQQILLALSQCFQQLSVQQSEMNNLQRQLHTLVLQSSRTDSTSTNSYMQNSFPTGVNQWKKPRHFCWEPYPQNPYLCSNRFSSPLLKPDAIQKTKARSNNMLSSTVPTTKSRKRTNSSDKNFRRRHLNKQHCDKDNAEKCPKGCSQTCSYFWNFSNTNKDDVVDVPARSKKLSASSRQKHTANSSSKNMTSEDGKKKLKSSQNTLEFKQEAPNASAKFYPKSTSNNSSSKKTKNGGVWSNKTTADLVNQCDSGATKKENISDQLDSNSFDSLKSDIYAEVAKLISQNEKHPKYMISLFQKLQCFDSYSKRDHIMGIIDALIEQARYNQTLFSSKFDEFPRPNLTSNRISLISDNAKIENTLRTKTQDSSSDDSGSEIIQVVAPVSDMHLQFAEDSLKKALHQMTKQHQAGSRDKILNRELHHSSHTAVDQGSESSVSDMVVVKSDNQNVSEIIKEISKQLIPIINLHKNETFSEVIISDVQQKIVILYRQFFSEQDINFKHLNSNLYNNLIEFKNQRVADCYHAVLKKISDVLHNELSYFRLMEDLGENTLSKSFLDRLTLFSQNTNDTSIVDQLRNDSDTTLVASGTQLLADGDLTTRDSLLSCHKKLSDNIQVDVKEKNRYENAEEMPNGFLSCSSKDSQNPGVPMEIELAVSETKPFSKIGSDEDDEDDDESHNAEDPSVTAVSLATEKENHCFPERGDGDIPSKIKNSDSGISGKPNGLLPKSSNDTNHTTPSNEHDQLIPSADDQLQVEDIPNVLQSLSNDQLEEAINDQFTPGAAFFENIEKNELAGDSEALPCNKLNSQFDAASDP
ncbi:Hypothetical predicted protein [Octopus vulgaris]|uniref:Pericentriolar material 1 protein C-terminal domain-containing protein n=1 Tax=Octopus vulgaris TaxID=6645 RepID=A0AA36AL93_OCTVU|nr:Hypothetical predicted protein [Octopus vulgaris]